MKIQKEKYFGSAKQTEENYGNVSELPIISEIT